MQRYAYVGRSLLVRTRTRRHRPLAAGAGLMALMAMGAVVALSRQPAPPMPGAPSFDLAAIYPHEEAAARSAPMVVAAVQAPASTRKAVRAVPRSAAATADAAQEPAATATDAAAPAASPSPTAAAAPSDGAQPA